MERQGGFQSCKEYVGNGILWIVGEGGYRLHQGTWKNNGKSRDGRPSILTEIVKFETLSNIMGAFKTTAATRVNKLRGMIGVPVWQRSFYDRIVREPRELECIQKYIENNPIKWEEDQNNPNNPEFGLQNQSVDDSWNEIFDIDR